MEQRTRILHHTRSKTPVILAPSKPKPRVPTQTLKPAKGREKAPLASLDTEVPNSSRRQAKPRDHNGSRSSSTGRHEPGSSRIVSRDFLKSDQISDRSGDDEDPASPCRSAPLRRHTMGSITRPRTKSQDPPEPTSSSRVSYPPEASSSHVGNHFPKEMKWNGARQDIPNGPVVKLPVKYPVIVNEASTNSKHSQLCRIASKVSDHNESLPNTTTPYHASSQTVLANSDSNEPQVSNNPKGHSRQDLVLHLQEKAIPTTLSSQLANRDSINLSSPVTSPVYSFSVSSQRSPNVHPPSSLNIHPSNLPSPSAVTSPSSSSQRNGLSPQLTSGYSWRTDPRRRPFQANGEFCLSPGDGSHHTRSPQQTSSPATVMESIHISSSMYTYTSPNPGQSSTLHASHSIRSDSVHDKNSSSSHISDQQQRSNSNRHPSNGFGNNGNATTPGSPTYRDAKQSLFNRKNSDSRRDASSETVQSSTSSSSDKSFESWKPSHLDNGPYTTFDIRPQSAARSPPPRQRSSSSPYDETAHAQTKSYHNLTFPRHDNTDKTTIHGTNSSKKQIGPFSTHIKEYNQIVFHNSSGQHSKTVAQSRYSESIYVDSQSSSGSGRNRDSMRLAREGYREVSYLSQSIDYADLPGSGNTAKYRLPEEKWPRREVTVEQRHTAGVPFRDDRQSAGSERFQVPEVQNATDSEESLPNDRISGPFVRGCRQRDSYRLATSSNPDLLTSTDQEEEMFISCEDILASDERELPRRSSTSMSKHDTISTSAPFQTLYDGRERISEKTASPSNTNLKPSINSEIFSSIKRNSLRLATASLSDLSVILDEIDIGEPPDTPTSNLETIEHPSPIFIRNCTNLSPLAERSLERSGSSVSSRNSSSFGSFYSCQSIGHTSAKNSPNHASSHSSPRDSRPKMSTPDSVHKLLTANGHDSGISQSSEDTNSCNTFANTSIGSSEEMEYDMNHLALGGSLNRKRPVFYWTRQSPYPRQNHNTIPASWKHREYSPSKSSIHSSPRYPKSGSIRSYGSTSSVESSSNKSKPAKHVPRSSQILQRYGCGLDRKSPKLCTRGSTDSLAYKTTHPKHQSPSRGGMSSGNRDNCTLPLPSSHNYRSDRDFDRYTQPQVPVSPKFVESPTTDNLRSPPSLGRPKRKLYAGFDSQPLPMDTFFSDSSSVCTDVSYSSHGTDVSGQPDSGNFDESFYSIDNRSLSDEKDCAFEASLTPKDFMNLTEIHKNSQLRTCRSNSLHSTSTAKEGDAEYSEEDEDAFEETMTPYHNHHPHHHVWQGPNYNQSVTTSLPMTFSI